MGDIRRIIRDVFRFILENREYWLLPAVVALLLFGALIATAGTAPVPVFVYPMA